MHKEALWKNYFIIILIFGACSVTTEEDTTATTTLPDYETTTLSGKISGTAWTFKTGRVTVPTSSSGYYSVTMINDNLSNACSSTYTGTSSNPTVSFSRETLTVGETELAFKSYGTVTFYDGSTNYIVTKGKISIDTHTTTAVTGKMYAIFGTDTDQEINGTFTLSRCCLSSGSYSLCSEWDYYNYGVCRQKVLRNNIVILFFICYDTNF